MDVGKLRHRVELHQVGSNQDSYGQSVRTWTKYDTVWASIIPLQGRELEHAKQISAETNFKVTIRYNKNVTVEDRVIFNERILEVTAVINVHEQNIMQFLFCKEIS